MKNKKETKMDENKSIAKFDAVIPSDLGSKESKWAGVLKEFEPLGAITECYVKTLAYKIETKRLDVEIERINAQAATYHDVIDKTFKLKMEELQQRRLSLNRFYDTVNKELDYMHIERTKVLEAALFAQKQMMNPQLTIEEKNMHKELSIEMIRQLPIFGTKSNEVLQKLVNALPPVAISSKLLEG